MSSTSDFCSSGNAQEYGWKDELHLCMLELKMKLEIVEEVKRECSLTAEYMKDQARYTKTHIKEQFKKLHQFLEQEEEARMAALREEEEQKSQMMKEKMEALSREIAALSDTVRATEEELRAEDVSFLHNYKAAVERVQQLTMVEGPQVPSGALINIAKHLGNLTFNIWSKMREMVSYTPVILDPNTAGSRLDMSKDLTSIKGGEEKQLPNNPERLNYRYSILGCESVNSGTLSWDVEFGDSTHWSVGVFPESAVRKGYLQTGLWAVYFSDGYYSAESPGLQITYLKQTNKLQRIRVNLDWDKGKLSFLNPDTNTHIHTFTHIFTERLFPYISCTGEEKILPLKISVTAEQTNFEV